MCSLTNPCLKRKRVKNNRVCVCVHKLGTEVPAVGLCMYGSDERPDSSGLYTVFAYCLLQEITQIKLSVLVLHTVHEVKVFCLVICFNIGERIIQPN